MNWDWFLNPKTLYFWSFFSWYMSWTLNIIFNLSPVSVQRDFFPPLRTFTCTLPDSVYIQMNKYWIKSRSEMDRNTSLWMQIFKCVAMPSPIVQPNQRLVSLLCVCFSVIKRFNFVLQRWSRDFARGGYCSGGILQRARGYRFCEVPCVRLHFPLIISVVHRTQTDE